jgi:hypothetical protein
MTGTPNTLAQPREPLPHKSTTSTEQAWRSRIPMSSRHSSGRLRAAASANAAPPPGLYNAVITRLQQQLAHINERAVTATPGTPPPATPHCQQCAVPQNPSTGAPVSFTRRSASDRSSDSIRVRRWAATLSSCGVCRWRADFGAPTCSPKGLHRVPVADRSHKSVAAMGPGIPGNDEARTALMIERGVAFTFRPHVGQLDDGSWRARYPAADWSATRVSRAHAIANLADAALNRTGAPG